MKPTKQRASYAVRSRVRATVANPETVARQIQAKIDAATEPLEREMRIMKWAPEYRAIVWEALARKVIALWTEAEKDKEGQHA